MQCDFEGHAQGKTALDRRYRRLTKRANRDYGGSDVCHGCGRPLADPEITLAGRAHGRFKVVAQICCGHTLSEILGFGVYLAPPVKPWVEDDRLLFDAHPRRTHRLRPAFPDEEFEPPDAWIVVRQIEPGSRARFPVVMPDQIKQIIANYDLSGDLWEGFARAIFDTLINAAGSGRDKVSPQELASYIHLLASEGQA